MEALETRPAEPEDDTAWHGSSWVPVGAQERQWVLSLAELHEMVADETIGDHAPFLSP